MTSVNICNLDFFLSTNGPPEGKRADEPIVERCVRLGLLEWFKYFCTINKFPNGYEEHGGVYKEKNDSLLCLAARYGHQNICEYVIEEWGVKRKYIEEAVQTAKKHGYNDLAVFLEWAAEQTE